MSKPVPISWQVPVEQVWTELNSEDQAKAIALMAQLAFKLIENKEIE